MQEYVLGIDVGGTNIKGGAVDYRGNILAHQTLSTEASLGAEAIFDKLQMLAAGLQSQVQDGRVKAAAIGIPGAILSTEGIVTQAPNIPSWDGMPIRKILQDRLQIPCFIENDANSMALGEMWMGAGRGYRNIVCLTLGTGIGGGVIIDGELLRGTDGMAAEPGHMTIDFNGPRCKCGSTGCLEMYSSATGMLHRLNELLPHHPTSSLAHVAKDAVTPELIYQHAQKGDTLAQNVISFAADGLGVGMASLVNIFNPELIIMAGGIAAAWDLLAPRAIEKMRMRAFKAMAARVKVVQAALGNDAGIYGNAYVAWERIHQTTSQKAKERSLAPWGFWQVLEDADDYKVKRIYVHPGHRLSYQKHQQREETWMIAAGCALITLDGKEIRLKAGETIHVGKTQAHRIANEGPGPLVFFEVQRGTYFGEDDIVRLADDYKRN